MKPFFLVAAFLLAAPAWAVNPCHDDAEVIMPGQCAGPYTGETTYEEVIAKQAEGQWRKVAVSDFWEPQPKGLYRCALQINNGRTTRAVLVFSGSQQFALKREQAASCEKHDFSGQTVVAIEVAEQPDLRSNWRLTTGIRAGMPFPEVKSRLPGGLMMGGFRRDDVVFVRFPERLDLAFAVRDDAAFQQLSAQEKQLLACPGLCLPVGNKLIEKAGLRLIGLRAQLTR